MAGVVDNKKSSNGGNRLSLGINISQMNLYPNFNRKLEVRQMTIWFWLSVAATVVAVGTFALLDRRPDLVFWDYQTRERVAVPMPWSEWIGGWFK